VAGAAPAGALRLSRITQRYDHSGLRRQRGGNGRSWSEGRRSGEQRASGRVIAGRGALPFRPELLGETDRRLTGGADERRVMVPSDKNSVYIAETPLLDDIQCTNGTSSGLRGK
jgi:hypothetical protein